jgi:hypothetical protein
MTSVRLLKVLLQVSVTALSTCFFLIIISHLFCYSLLSVSTQRYPNVQLLLPPLFGTNIDIPGFVLCFVYDICNIEIFIY